MIKFLDIESVNKPYEREFNRELDNFFRSGNYILGDQVLRFEEEFAAYCGTKFCIGVSNGLDALKMIFEAYKILGKLSDGDEVIVPANTYIASVLAISNTGLNPILVEPDSDTFNIDPGKIENARTSKTKAILGVHLYGRLYDVDALENVARKNDLLLIEDAAQAHGAVYSDGRKAGNVSDVAAFSFYPTKTLGALGDAGAITTNNAELAKIISRLRNYGRASTYDYEIQGHNCRLDEMQATFLRIKLRYLDNSNNDRRKIAGHYLEHISSKHIVVPNYPDMQQHVFYLFVVMSERRNELKAYLEDNGVETLIHYPKPIHKQKAYKEFNDLGLPITERIHDQVLSLPLYPTLAEKQVLEIIALINSF